MFTQTIIKYLYFAYAEFINVITIHELQMNTQLHLFHS